MKNFSRFLFGFLVLVALSGSLWLVHSYLLRVYGTYLIQQERYDKLEDLVRGRPGLATQLLGYAYQANEHEMFEMLFSHGADVNVAKLQTEWGPYPLLHHLARDARVFWLKTSLDHGGDPNLKARFGITPLWSSLEARQSANAMAIIEAGANIHGKVMKQTFFDLAVEELQFEPAYKMLEMGVDPDGSAIQFPDAVSRLWECCNGKGLDEVTVQNARKDRWFQKIIVWYQQWDRDIENAIYVPRVGNQPGGWRIPSFAEREKKTEEKQ